MAAPDAQPQGFYSTTSGTYFSDKDSLAEHYKSDFHKYNLKRKVTGLPPVTKEWFDARKEQLSTTATSVGPVQKIWYDPLTKKKFSSENTYVAHVNSKKYKDLVKKNGQEAPAPVVTMRRADGAGMQHSCDDLNSRRACMLQSACCLFLQSIYVCALTMNAIQAQGPVQVVVSEVTSLGMQVLHQLQLSNQQ